MNEIKVCSNWKKLTGIRTRNKVNQQSVNLILWFLAISCFIIVKTNQLLTTIKNQTVGTLTKDK